MWKQQRGLAVNTVKGRLKVQGSYGGISIAIEYAQSLGISPIVEGLLQLNSRLTQNHNEGSAQRNHESS